MMTRKIPLVWQKLNIPFALLLIVGMVHGLIYVFTVPPWQHPDEPGNFEIVWLAVHRPERLHAREYDPEGRRLIFESMVRTNLFGPDKHKDLLAAEPTVVVSQLAGLDSPLYFQLAGIPVRWMAGQPIEQQLYAARLVSWLLFLISIVAGWLAASELFGRTSPVAWMVPFFMAALPGYVDIMTSVNNDVGAASFFSLFVWAAVRLIRRPFAWQNALVALALALTAAAMKVTALVAVPFFLAILILKLLWSGKRKIILAGMAAGLLVAAAALLRPVGARSWLPYGSQSGLQRVKLPDGEGHAFRVQTHAQPALTAECGVFQVLPDDTVRALRGRTVTVGAWMWSDRERSAYLPLFVEYHGQDDLEIHGQAVTVGPQPAFYAFTAALDRKSQLYMLRLSAACNQEEGQVFWDDVVVIDSETIPAGAPQPDGAQTVLWDGKTYQNFARNPSFEAFSLTLLPAAAETLDAYLPIYQGIAAAVGSLQDWQGFEWYYERSFNNLFATFWQTSGWGYSVLRTDLPIIAGKPYRVPKVLALLGAVGFVIYLIRCRRRLPIGVILFLTTATAVVTEAAILRLLLELDHWLQVPWARYVFPVIVPVTLILCTGWNELIEGAGRLLKRKRNFFYGLWIVLILAFDVFALNSALVFFESLGH